MGAKNRLLQRAAELYTRQAVKDDEDTSDGESSDRDDSLGDKKCSSSGAEESDRRRNAATADVEMQDAPSEGGKPLRKETKRVRTKMVTKPGKRMCRSVPGSDGADSARTPTRFYQSERFGGSDEEESSESESDDDRDCGSDSESDGGSDIDVDGDGDSEDNVDSGPHAAQKTRRRGMWKERIEMIENHPEIKTEIKPLAPQVFSTWENVEAVMAQYMADTLTSYRTRDSMTLQGYKSKLANANAKEVADHKKALVEERLSRAARETALAAGVSWDCLPPVKVAPQLRERREPIAYPNKAKYVKKSFWCTHGCIARSRGDGHRTPGRLNFTGCAARIQLQLTNVVSASGKTKWKIVVTRENTVHNHNISPAIFACYLRRSDIASELLLGTMEILASTNTQTKQIASYVSNSLGMNVDSQMIRNILAARLGGSNAELRMKKLVLDFLKGQGNHCAFIRDHKKMTAGMTIQSRAQTAVFEHWPETVVLDWTYNTNNLGFNLGSLIVTGATGRGLPVYEFLSVTENEDALTIIMKYFKNSNPAWEKIEAFVIDKDFTELKVLKALFPRAMIFLCFFHALRAVSRAVSQTKYGLAPQICLNIEARFAELMFCRTQESYNLYVELFRLYVSEISEELLAYFEKWWFECYLSWTNVGRATAFSCGNTTTNRVETNWTQVKAVIGNKTGIDKCVSALLQHQLTIFRGLDTKISRHSAGSRMLSGIPKFLRPMSALLSDFALDKVLKQWTYYLAHHRAWKIKVNNTPRPFDADMPTPLPWQKKTKIKFLQCTTTNGVYTINTAPWSCSCFFFVSMRLPCQHMIYAAKSRKKASLPAAAVHDRWNMIKARELLQEITAGVADLSRLHYGTAGVGPLHDATEEFVAASLAAEPKIKYVKLPGRRHAKKIVLSKLEKRNVVRSETDRLMHALQQSGSGKFYVRFEQMREMIDGLLLRWSADETSNAGAQEPNDGDVLGDGSEDEEETQFDGLEDEFDSCRFADVDTTDVDHIDDEVRCVLWNVLDLVELAAEQEEEPENDRDDLHDSVSDNSGDSDSDIGDSDIVMEDPGGDMNEDTEINDAFQLHGLGAVPAGNIWGVETSQVAFSDLSMSPSSVIAINESPSYDSDVQENGSRAKKVDPVQSIASESLPPGSEKGDGVQREQRGDGTHSTKAKKSETKERETKKKMPVYEHTGRKKIKATSAPNVKDSTVKDVKVSSSGDQVAVRNEAMRLLSTMKAASLNHADYASSDSDPDFEKPDPTANTNMQTQRSVKSPRYAVPLQSPAGKAPRSRIPSSAAKQPITTDAPTWLDLKFPKPARGKMRTEPKKKAAKLVVPSCLVEERELAAMRMDEFVAWTMKWQDLYTVAKTARVYKEMPVPRGQPTVATKSFAAPYGMHSWCVSEPSAHKLLGAIDIAKKQDIANGKETVDDVHSEAPGKRELYAARFKSADSPHYTELYVLSVLEYYRVRKLATQWSEDMTWVKKLPPKPGGPFDSYFHQQGKGFLQMPLHVIAANVKRQFADTALSQRFQCTRLCTGETLEVVFEIMIKRMAGKAYVSGYVLCFLMNLMLAPENKGDAPRDDVFILDPMDTDHTAFKPPPSDPRKLQFLVQPVNIDGVHWTVLIVVFDWNAGTTKLVFYEPTAQEDHWETMELVWSGFTKPLVESWLQRHHPGADVGRVECHYITKPVQDDSHNCGFLCLALVYNVTNGLQVDYSLLKDFVYYDKDLITLRMKCLHLILCDAERVDLGVGENIVKIGIQVARYWQGAKRADVAA